MIDPIAIADANRRDLHGRPFLLVAAIAVVAANVLFAGSLAFAEPSADKAGRPNIVFIMADDLGFADVAFHGGNAPTPQLDRLVAEGVELTQHYVAPVCSPTRTGLMTGRCWSRFGVTAPQNERAMPWDTVTLPRALKSVGYETCLTGKWHLGSLPEEGPNHFGFDHSYGSLAGGVTPWLHFYKKGPVSRTWHRDEQFVDEQGHVTDLIAKEAVEWLGKRGDAPFFLYVPFTAIHLPIKEPQEWVDRVPSAITGEVPRHYAACIMHFDDAVSRIVSAVEKAGKRGNTLIVVTSDNGGSTSENNDLKYPDDNCPNGKLTGNNKPLRGEKGNVYEGGTRVAAVASWPGKLKPGKMTVPVQIIDWMPTFCALAGYKPDHDLKWDGVDIGPLLSGEKSTMEPRSLYCVGPGWRERSLRHGDWKLIVSTKGEPQLFNLADDPNETTDLAKQQPERVAEMQKRLDAIATADNEVKVQKGT